MNSDKRLRLAFVVTIGIVTAAFLGLISASIALSNRNEMLAASLFPLNGMAEAEVASGIFKAEVVRFKDPEIAAGRARLVALSAYKKEPLSPETHAILALGEPNNERRSQLVSLASQLNRRNQTLQALVLKQNVESGNYTGAVETLDRILRVRPSRADELFPVLLSVFTEPGAETEFIRVLDGSSQWHKDFVNYAVGQPDALLNLTRWRMGASFQDSHLDRQLLINLAENRQLKNGFALYDIITGTDRKNSRSRVFSWGSQYEPFEWRLIDTPEFRAQHSIDSEALELYVRPGNGGVFASRLIRSPKAPFHITAQHQIAPVHLAHDVKLSVRCAYTNERLATGSFEEQAVRIEVEAIPSSCRYLEIFLEARAWSGQSALNGTISPLSLVM